MAQNDTITVWKAKGALRALAAREPERSNNGACAYVVESQPNCIVAQALTDLGVDVVGIIEKRAAEGEAFEGWTNGLVADTFIRTCVERKVTPAAERVLTKAQGIADSSPVDDEGEPDYSKRGTIPWSEAVAEALAPEPHADSPF